MDSEREKLSHPLKVLSVVRETTDAVSICLDIPSELKNKFQYRAGQFITLFLEIDKVLVRRSYSLSSSPEVDKEFKITVKLVAGGKASPLLSQKIKPGDILWAAPPSGGFCLPSRLENQQFVFFAAGSGITPVISLIKSALSLSTTCQCHLIYQNRNEASVIFKNELEQLVKTHSNQLKIYYCVNDGEKTNFKVQNFLPSDKSFIKNYFKEHQLEAHAIHFLCGPDGFMKPIEQNLSDLKFANSQIIKESFNVFTESQNQPLDIDEGSILIGDSTKNSKPQTIVALFDGESHEVPYKGTKTILETLLTAGLNPPYSCMNGACMACLAKVDEGLVYQNELFILSDDNIDAQECLTCQARPASKKTVVNYNPV